MIVSLEMYGFLKSYVKWIEEGAIEGSPYSREWGLCINISCLTCSNIWDLLRKEFKTLFQKEGFDLLYPFGKETYQTHFKNQTQHEDPVRLKWIKDHIQEYEEVNNI